MITLRIASAFVTLLLLSGYVFAAPAVRTVQVGAAETSAEAEALVEHVEASGYGPVFTVEDDDFTRVYVGRCVYYIDSFILMDWEKGTGTIYRDD